LDKTVNTIDIVLLYNLGASRLTVSLAEIIPKYGKGIKNKDKMKGLILKIIDHYNVEGVGGIHLNDKISNIVLSKFKIKYPKANNPLNNNKSRKLLVEASEKIKITLSANNAAF